MENIVLTPEQEALAQRSWDMRRGPATYVEDIMGAPPTPEVRAEMEEMLRRDPDSTAEDYEEWLRLRETNVDASKQYQWLPPEEYANEEMRIGRLIHSSQFIVMLREQCKLRCWYGDPQKMLLKGDAAEDAHAFGYESLEQMADAGWNVKEDRKPNEGAKWLGLQVLVGEGQPIQFVCGVQEGWMAEYEVVYFNPYGLPLNSKYRGWRTVLLRLILKGALDEELAHKVFGPATAPCAGRYNQTLHAWRNRPRKETAALADRPVVGEQGNAPQAPNPEIPQRVCIETVETKASRCDECFWGYGEHRPGCTRAKPVDPSTGEKRNGKRKRQTSTSE
jgi:hypothetical protein